MRSTKCPLSDEIEVSRNLPWKDPSVEALTPKERAGLGVYWQDRARAELRVSHAFHVLGEELAATGVSEVVRDLVRRTIEDEKRHSGLCLRLSERYSGLPALAPLVPPESLPAFEGAPPELRVALHVMGLSCINETIAVSWLKGCLDGASAPLARAATRVHFREEIDHARLGWAHLASRHVSEATRRGLGLWLVRLLRANVPQWFRPDASLPPEGVPAHGAPSLTNTCALALEAVREVVLPGLATVGVDPAAGYAWLALVDPTVPQTTA